MEKCSCLYSLFDGINYLICKFCFIVQRRASYSRFSNKSTFTSISPWLSRKKSTRLLISNCLFISQTYKLRNKMKNGKFYNDIYFHFKPGLTYYNLNRCAYQKINLVLLHEKQTRSSKFILTTHAILVIDLGCCIICPDKKVRINIYKNYMNT